MVTHPTLQNASLRLRYLLNRFVEDRLNASAAALTFVSLFALVPLLTVTLSIASALPAAGNIEEKLNEFLLQFLLPESSTQVVEYLSTFISQARSLTAFGVIILLVSAILMLRNIEKALNDSWRSIRDTLISAQLLKRLDRGHYLLSRDLHHLTLAELAKLLRAEPGYKPDKLAMPWQQTAATLLKDNLDQESSRLATPLAELFATEQTPSA